MGDARRPQLDPPPITVMGAFSATALRLAAAGLAVLPLGGDDGKVPLVKWAHWKSRPGAEFIRTLIATHPSANIGIICGLSGVTVVDIDDLDLVQPMIERFGDTPLRTQTPSGGRHHWYRSAGEECRNLRKSEGLAIDIKGYGGQVVVPPSVRFNGQFAGRCYALIAGSWEELPRLPKIRPGALPAPNCQTGAASRSPCLCSRPHL
jgi:bifunctional DNA primase/polymerase-like protein